MYRFILSFCLLTVGSGGFSAEDNSNININICNLGTNNTNIIMPLSFVYPCNSHRAEDKILNKIKVSKIRIDSHLNSFITVSKANKKIGKTLIKKTKKFFKECISSTSTYEDIDEIHEDFDELLYHDELYEDSRESDILRQLISREFSALLDDLRFGMFS